jgi:hypothetical protein
MARHTPNGAQDSRAERLAEALRQNLRRRKAQQRERQSAFPAATGALRVDSGDAADDLSQDDA